MSSTTKIDEIELRRLRGYEKDWKRMAQQVELHIKLTAEMFTALHSLLQEVEYARAAGVIPATWVDDKPDEAIVNAREAIRRYQAA